MTKFLDCEKCGTEKCVFYDSDLPNICENCLPDYMCQSCGSTHLVYFGNKANGTWWQCNDCAHTQSSK